MVVSQAENPWNVINASFPKDARENSEPAIKELLRLKVGLQEPKRAYDEKKKEYTETEEQFLKRAKTNGAIIQMEINKVYSLPKYKNMTDEEKKEAFEVAIADVPMN